MTDLKYNIVKDFPKKGVSFVDFTPTFTDNNMMKTIASIFTSLTDNLQIDYIICPESRGFILGYYISSYAGCNCIPIRKHGKLPIIGSSISYKTEYSTEILDIPKIDLTNKTCMFVDDVYATGGTYYACKQLVEDLGGKVIGSFCLYDVMLDENPNLFSLMTRNDL